MYLYICSGKHQLLCDKVHDLATKSFLKLCKLNFTAVEKGNAEFMSSSGLPFIVDAKAIVNEYSFIVSHFTLQNKGLLSHLSHEERIDIECKLIWLDSSLVKIMNYISWIDNQVYKETAERYGSRFAWPLSIYLPYTKRQSVQNTLAVDHWDSFSRKDIEKELRLVCHALSVLLENSKFLHSHDGASEIDVLAYAFLKTWLNPQREAALDLWPEIQKVPLAFPLLTRFVRHMDALVLEMAPDLV